MTKALYSFAVALALAAPATAETIRFATFNASMNRSSEGQLAADLASGTNAQLQAVAEIIQRVNPDVLLVNEFDYSVGNPALFASNYLNVPQNASGEGTTDPIDFSHTFIAPSNTGVASGLDLNNDGSVGGPDDAYGFGFFPGQYGMAVFSKYDIDESAVRTFQQFLWKDLPDARLPADPLDADGNGDTSAWYTDTELDAVRLSSKSHWDIPITVDGKTIHFLTSHPTPPVFDGPEDRNGLRNADEIRFWADYVAGADYVYDDAGGTGGLPPDAFFVIAGDQNSDPFDGDSLPGAIQQLLDSPHILGSATDPFLIPGSPGGPDAAARQDGANDTHIGNALFDTADFADGTPGNIRADYVLPSKTLSYVGGGIFWPPSDDPLFSLVGDFPFPASDHRLVWVDVAMAPVPLPAGSWLLFAGLGLLGSLRRRG